MHGNRGRAVEARSTERGETLIEVLVAVMLMAIIVAAILTALFVLVRTAALNKEKTRAGIAVQAVVEQLKQPVGAMAYVPCATVADYQTMVEDRLDNDTDAGLQGYDVAIKGVSYLEGQWAQHGTRWEFEVQGTPNQLDRFVSTCPGTQTEPNGTERDGGTQRIEAEVTSAPGASHDVHETLWIVKRDARCPDENDLGYTNPDAGPC